MHRRSDFIEKWGSIAAIVCVAVGFLYVHSLQAKIDKQQIKLDAQQSELDHQHHQLGSQYDQLISSCKRFQIIRVEDNISHYVDWKVFRVVLPFVPPSVAPQLRDAIARKSWIPVTNCKKAVNIQGIHYRAPRPVAFNHRLPPKSALDLAPLLFK